MTSGVKKLALVLFGVDVLMIVLHLATGGATTFNLDAEANLPTWYSSAKLLTIAWLAVAAWHFEQAGNQGLKWNWMWLGVAGTFGALSIDETASLHERVARALVAGGPARNLRTLFLGGDAAKDSFAWPILFAPLAIAIFVFLIAFAWSRRAQLKRVLILGAAGIGCYVLAIVLEPLGVFFTPPLENWTVEIVKRYEMLTVIEESAEVIGTTLLLITAFAYVVAVRDPAATAPPVPPNAAIDSPE